MRPVQFKFYFFLLIFSICFGVLFQSCKDETEGEFAGFETDFYPLEIGKFWEYQVDSVTYAIGGNRVDSTTSFIREEIVDEFIDASGDTVARIDKFWKRNINDDWQIQKAVTATRSGTQAIRTEDNLRFIKMVLPPNVGSSWDSNVFIDPFEDFRVAGELVKIYKDWTDAEVIDRQSTASVNGVNYADLVTVVLTESESIIERRFAQEQYAKGIGLVSADYMILDTQCNSCGPDWPEDAEQGYTLKQVLINHN